MIFKRIYLEITNVCNLSCSFCPGTRRAPRFLSADDFSMLLKKLRPFGRDLYLHVMGEPLLHPDLETLLREAGAQDFSVCLTTNGTLLPEAEEVLLRSPALRKVSVSLHSMEGNGRSDVKDYLSGALHFADRFDGIVVFRLWNEGGESRQNGCFLDALSLHYGCDVAALPERCGSRKIAERRFLESAEKFDWPSLSAEPCEVTYCHALSQQIAVLSDGTVVPCCLDGEGVIALGNLLSDPLDKILSSARALEFRRGIAGRQPAEELCRRCGFATRFSGSCHSV